MKLSTTSHKKIENFFREHFKDDEINLPNFHIHCGKWARRFTKLLKIHGITLGNHVIISPDFVRRDERGKLVGDFSLIVHEATHVLQYKNEGFFGFLWNYLKAWFAHLKQQKKRDIVSRQNAYYAIPHEEEARAAAANYTNWREENKI
ncbi:MAG: DUF4157 domain-containing protein [Pyrinomonadaceae bacterium]|nr:DUF4157 domain-containing protein [Pyrinomonadaceae bacterium]